MVDQKALDQVIACYPILKKVDKTHLEQAMQNARVLSATTGDIMFEETEKSRGFPFILTGSARVIKLSSTGRELHLYTVGAGEGCIVACSSLLGDIPCNATAIVEQNLTLVSLPPSDFRILLSQSEPFRNYIFSNFAENLTLLTHMVSAVVFQKLDQRLANALVTKKSPIQATHQALADELGSVREIVSRLLKNFVEKGWVTLERGQINVLNSIELKKYSEL